MCTAACILMAALHLTLLQKMTAIQRTERSQPPSRTKRSHCLAMNAQLLSAARRCMNGRMVSNRSIFFRSIIHDLCAFVRSAQRLASATPFAQCAD